MIFEKIDTYLIAKFAEPVAHRIQKETGRNCYWVAWFFTGMTVLAAFFSANMLLQDYQRIGNGTLGYLEFWNKLALIPVFILICVPRLYKLQRLSGKSAWQVAEAAQSRTIVGVFMRTCMLILALWAMGRLALSEIGWTEYIKSDLAWLFLTVSEYFSACTPLPPKIEREEETTNRKAAIMNREAA